MEYDLNDLYSLAEDAHDYDMQMASFNAQQAEMNRAWQEKMSNTAHEREIQDLLRSGLNPVLSAKYGGASVPSGATASGSNSASSVLSSAFSSILGSATQMMTASMQRQTELDKIDKDLQVARIAQAGTLGSAQIYTQSNERIENAKELWEDYIKSTYPQNAWQTLVPLGKQLIDKIWPGLLDDGSSEPVNDGGVVDYVKDIIDDAAQGYKTGGVAGAARALADNSDIPISSEVSESNQFWFKQRSNSDFGWHGVFGKIYLPSDTNVEVMSKFQDSFSKIWNTKGSMGVLGKSYMKAKQDAYFKGVSLIAYDKVSNIDHIWSGIDRFLAEKGYNVAKG